MSHGFAASVEKSPEILGNAAQHEMRHIPENANLACALVVDIVGKFVGGLVRN